MAGPFSVCKPCKKRYNEFTKVIFDQSTGDIICTKCGLVLQEKCIDETQEWRNFASDSVEYGMKLNSRQRGGDVDGIVDQLTGSTKSTAFNTSVPGFEGLQYRQEEAERQTLKLSSSDEALRKATHNFHVMNSRLRLNQSILQRCIELIKHLAEKNLIGPKGKKKTWYFAIIYLACREEQASRSFRELATLGCEEEEAEDGRGNIEHVEDFEKSMKKSVQSLTDPNVLGSLLKPTTKSSRINPQEMVPRFVSKCGLTQEVCNPALHVVNKAQQIVFRQKRPGMGSEQNAQSAIIAAAIFIVTHLLDPSLKISLQDVAINAKVPLSNVMTAYESMRGSAELLLPESFKSRLQNCELPPTKSASAGSK